MITLITLKRVTNICGIHNHNHKFKLIIVQVLPVNLKTDISIRKSDLNEFLLALVILTFIVEMCPFSD